MGLIPLISETSLQAQFLIPMAISLAFGVLFATLVSLLLVPCTYVFLDDIQVAFRRAFSSGGEENVTVEDAYDEGFKQGNSKARKVNPYSSDLLAASWDAGYQDGTEAR